MKKNKTFPTKMDVYYCNDGKPLNKESKEISSKNVQSPSKRSPIYMESVKESLYNGKLEYIFQDSSPYFFLFQEI